MASRTDVLLRCLLRLLVDVSADPGLSDSVRLQLMEGSSASLRLLDAATQQRVQVSHLVVALQRRVQITAIKQKQQTHFY